MQDRKSQMVHSFIIHLCALSMEGTPRDSLFSHQALEPMWSHLFLAESLKAWLTKPGGTSPSIFCIVEIILSLRPWFSI